MMNIQVVDEQKLSIKKKYCDHEQILRLTNARIRLAVVVVWWMCCSMTSLVMETRI